jgi:hypothetical protein
MNAANIIAASSITAAWCALGGDRPTKFGRARAFYRDGDNSQAVSLNEAKGCWYDHRDNVGGGVLDLIQRVLGCSRIKALRWLSEFTGIPLEDRKFSPAERRRYGRSLARAEQLARDVADFEHGLELFLRYRANQLRAVTHALLAFGAEPGDLLQRAVQDLAMLGNADPESVVAVYRALPECVRSRFREEGRLDREHAERVTQAIVEMLARPSIMAVA